MAHVPLLHVAAALLNKHGLKQAPQFAVDVLVFVSQPLPITPSQFP
jgi:hypothetical protein